ncbi:MAG: hypothetical protein J6032_01500 [Bacteroidales bacterium]|nr:hypothetical protein [Bacteroidales bacterium]
MTNNFRQITRTVLSTLTLGALLTACFDDNESETVVTDYSNCTVTSMSLSANAKVCSNLSNYSFTIDQLGTSDTALIANWRSVWEKDEYTLQPGVIFNQDSLPVGSIADSIKISLSYSSPYSVIFYQYDEDMNLLNRTNYSDTQIVWFDDYAVTRLEIVAQDRLTNKSYFVKMNVHTCPTDTIRWKYLAGTDLFDMTEVTDQRVDTLGRTLCWFTTLSSTQEVRTASLTGDITEWSSPQTVNAPATIQLGTLLNWNGTLYAVGADSTLLMSADGLNWTAASADFKFVNLIGAQLPIYKKAASESDDTYNEHLCAIVALNGEHHFTRLTKDSAAWRLDTALICDGVQSSKLPDGFPVGGYTRPISVAAKPSKGNTTSRLYISGGIRADGTLLSSTWSSDGSYWVEFPQNILPPMKNASIIRYTLDADEPGTFWIMQPGLMQDGHVTDTLYFSQNSGVTWKKLYREYPQYADTYKVDPIACHSAFMNPRNYYMYFFGGVDENGNQRSTIQGGQLQDLDFEQAR